MTRLALPLCLVAALLGSNALTSGAAEPTLPAIDGAAVLEHTKLLASDAFEGRAPGTKGEELTVAYLTDQLKAIGLQPGHPDGSWIQKVPLVGTTVQGTPTLTFRKGAEERRLAWRDDYVAWTKRTRERVAVDASELVFVGKPADYGLRVREAYVRDNYHKPSDRVQPDWDMSGAVEDLTLYLQVGHELTSDSAWPEWKPGAAWKSLRDEMLRGAGGR